MKNFQNSSVYSRVPSYRQTLKKSQTRRLWNKPRVPTRPTNTSVVVDVSSFPCLDLPFRNDSICLALECYLVTWDVLFSEACSCKRILQKETGWQRSVGSYFACPVFSWALTSCSKSSVHFSYCSLNPCSLWQPDRSFKKCHQVLSLSCLRPFSCFLYFFRIKSEVVSTTISHSLLLLLYVPLFCPSPQTVQAPFCLRTFALLFTLSEMFAFIQPFQLQAHFHSSAFSSNITTLEAVLDFPPPLHLPPQTQFNFFITLTTASICLAYLLVYCLLSS